MGKRAGWVRGSYQGKFTVILECKYEILIELISAATYEGHVAARDVTQLLQCIFEFVSMGA